MQKQCSAELSVSGRVEGRLVVAGFDGGALTSDAGGNARLVGEIAAEPSRPKPRPPQRAGRPAASRTSSTPRS